MPIHFGFPTLLQLPTLSGNLALCAELGLDFVEINMNLPYFQPGNIDVAETKRLLVQSGKYVTFHLDENLSICDFNPLVANAYLETVRQTIALAKELSASLINMHLSDGVYFTLPEGKVFLFEQNSGQYFTDLQRWIFSD